MVDWRLNVLSEHFNLCYDVLTHINDWLIYYESKPYHTKFLLSLEQMMNSVEYEKEIYEMERRTRYKTYYRATGRFFPIDDLQPRATPMSKRLIGKYKFFYLSGYIVTRNFLDKSEWDVTLPNHSRHFMSPTCPFCQLKNGCMPRNTKTGKKKLVFTKSFMKKWHPDYKPKVRAKKVKEEEEEDDWE